MGQQEANLGEHWGPGGEVTVEPAPGLAVTELPADGLRGHVRHGVDDVAVEDPDVLGLAPAVAAGVLRDAVLAGTGGLAAAEQDTHVLKETFKPLYRSLRTRLSLAGYPS